MRKCSISLAIKEMQCKTPMRGLPWLSSGLRLCTPNAGAVGLIPDQETRSCMPQFKIPLKVPQVATKDTGTAKKKKKKNPTMRGFPGSLVVRTWWFYCWGQVQSLFRELRYHKLPGQKQTKTPQWDILSNLPGWLWSKRQIITNVDKDVEKLEILCIAGGSVKWYSPFEKQSGSSLKC